MEIIKNIKEVSDVYFNNDKWDTYDGYCIETDSRKLYFVINNGQCCCENWGYLSSEDDFGSFIGSELKNVYVTDSELGTIVSNMKEGLIMLIKATAIVKFSGIYKWDIINPLKDCLKNGKPIKNEQLG